MTSHDKIAISTDLAVILDMLGVVLIEIRASDNLKTCQALANTFHNVPARIISGDTSENVLDEIFSAAERSKIDMYVKKLYEHSKKKLSSTQ